jgi:hypothetical protein
MKFNLLSVLIAGFTLVYSKVLPSLNSATNCGTLGLMTYEPSSLFQNVKQEDIRKCLEHPIGDRGSLALSSIAPTPDYKDEKAVESEIASSSNPLTEPTAQLCESAPYGCTRGYCWRNCGEGGQWCWTAKNEGLGDWITCTKFQDCADTKAACGRNCARCGCSC